MAKDYMQDILPPQNNGDRRSVPIRPAAPTPPSPVVDPGEDVGLPPQMPERSIRNISAPQRNRQRPADDGMTDMRDTAAFSSAPRGSGGRKWLWSAAVVGVVIVAALLLVALRATKVTVVPRTHAVSFDGTSQFTAYPSESAPAGMLPYAVQTVELEDSEVVQSQGTVHAEDKASGNITIFNEYSAAPVKLIKNTRFQTADGLVFRAPADIVVPGKKGTAPGQISVTIIADAAGEKYNTASTAKLTLPGLKSSDMYTKVYAQASSAFSGGFIGERPGVAQADMTAAVARVRARLEQKARDAVTALNKDATVAFSDLAVITYESLPNTTEAGGGVRLHEKARVQIPVFPADAFAHAVAQAVSADADTASVRLMPGAGFAAHTAASSTALGAGSVQFTMTGAATLIWDVDSSGLAQALAGKDQGAFQSIITGFPSIQEAHARIEPFWSNSFPKDPADIAVVVETPQAQ